MTNPSPRPQIRASAYDEHFKAAEEALAFAKDADAEANPEDVKLMLRFANAHAVLAQAAAIRDAAAGGAR